MPKRKLLLSLPSNAQLVSVKEYKSLAVEGYRDDYLFCMNAQNIFFQLPKLNKYCLGVELAAAHQVTKKAENGSSEGLHPVSHSMPQRLHNVIKNNNNNNNKKGMPATEILYTDTP